ncbi:hypothetical protein XcuCFBP2542_15280 [Xanthomonas cucurbitae]|uniref:RDD family protein n=1 Tax=Xanthomonas cucurbitae TaxID=56453 RepID=A0A2S7DKP3_9XANT|nr:RDD family protein [Xanthomonas cucurbitae]PPU74334.1 hypothetical protein XcuCFBP2542_15280 [Xanthomonas cucurbitae]
MSPIGMEQYWYAQENGGAVGGTRLEIQAWFAEGRLRPDTLMWTAGMADWKAYATCSLFHSAPPELPVTGPEPQPLPERLVTKDRRANPHFGSGDFLAPMSRVPQVLPADAPPLHVYADGWQDVRPHPWRRYFARSFDSLALGMLLWFAIGMVVGTVSPPLYSSLVYPLISRPLVSGMLTTLLLVAMLAIWIGLCGSSPGKWLFGIRVLRPDGYALGVADAFCREGRIFVFGMGLGLPPINMVVQLFALVHLINAGSTSWDSKPGWVVTHRPTGRWQTGLYVVAGITALALVALLRWLK